MTTACSSSPDVRVRWLAESDLREACAAEQESAEAGALGVPFCGRDFRHYLDLGPFEGGALAAWDLKTMAYLGHLCFETRDVDHAVRRLTVRPSRRLRRAGFLLTAKLACLPGRRRRDACSCCVRERDLGLQLFFRSIGWKCVKTIPGWFRLPPPAEAAYQFLWRRPAEVA